MGIQQPQKPKPPTPSLKRLFPESGKGAENQSYRSYSYKVIQAEHWASNSNIDPEQQTNNDRDLSIERNNDFFKYTVFSKTLPHTSKGEISQEDFDVFQNQIRSGEPLVSVPSGGPRKFVNPQAAYCSSLSGVDPCNMNVAIPPSFTSRTMASEMIEVYEQSMSRELTFLLIESSSANTALDRAVSNLNSFGEDFLGKKIAGNVTRKSLFRGAAEGTELGPYISQFLYHEIPYGAGIITQKYNTETGTPYGTALSDYLDIQNGVIFDPDSDLSGTFKYIHTPKVLGSFVHRDAIFQSFLNAALILLGHNADFDPNNPYLANSREESFVTFGIADILSHLANVSSLALKSAWAQKWGYHLRLRPEAYACRVHFQDIGDTNYNLHEDLMNSSTLTAIKSFNASGTGLLPLQYPEGSPAHPSYPAGHAAFSGACATFLKAFFDESVDISSLFSIVHSVDGDSLVPYPNSTTGMTVGTELNKLASNISIGRDWAGVHYRSDGDFGMALGEKIAIAYLTDLASGYPEDFEGFHLTKFDGSSIIINSI